MFDEEMNAQSESIPESSSTIPCCPSAEAQETMGAADGRVSGWRGFFRGGGSLAFSVIQIQGGDNWPFKLLFLPSSQRN